MQLLGSCRERYKARAPTVGADWLWQALQHRGPFANFDAQALAAELQQAKDSASSSSSFFLSPFAHPLPVHDSSIKPYYHFQSCDADTLSLFVSLKAVVRYHRIRGLIVPGSGAGAKKGAQAGRKQQLHATPDPILHMLRDIAEEEENERLEAAMEIDSPAPAARKKLRARNNATSSLPSTFMGLLQDTRLLPTSLNVPCPADDNSIYLHIPLSTQLMAAKFHSVLPPAFQTVTGLRPKEHKLDLAFFPASVKLGSVASSSSSSSSASSSASAAEDAWLESNLKVLPKPHRRLMKLFYRHVRVPTKETATAAATSASASSSSSLPSPLQDASYHFNLTAFSSALLHHLYHHLECHTLIAPIDPLSDRLRTYYRYQIKNPLSMYDVDMRVLCGYYDSVAELVSDLWRCFENTLLYHRKPFHAHENESEEQQEERESKEGTERRDMVARVAEIWLSIRRFFDQHFVAFMSHQPGGGGGSKDGVPLSPRCQPAVLQSTLKQLRSWMEELGGREVQSLRLLWIKEKEIERDSRLGEIEREDEELLSPTSSSSKSKHSSSSSSSSASTLARPHINVISQWQEWQGESTGDVHSSEEAEGDEDEVEEEEDDDDTRMNGDSEEEGSEEEMEEDSEAESSEEEEEDEESEYEGSSEEEASSSEEEESDDEEEAPPRKKARFAPGVTSNGRNNNSGGANSNSGEPPARRGPGRPRKYPLPAATAAARSTSRSVSPMSARSSPSPSPSTSSASSSGRPTRHRIQLDDLLDPCAPFPPLGYSRSRLGKHAGNIPRALVRKLARRAGKVPFAWDTKWFYIAKKK